MITKQEFYKFLKNGTNKYNNIDFCLRFESNGINCVLNFGITKRWIPKTNKTDWYIEAQLLNDKDLPLQNKYIAKDLYGKLTDLGISSDYKCWKYIENWVKTNIEDYIRRYNYGTDND